MTQVNNEGCSPLTFAAHQIRSFRDWVVNLIDKILLWIPEMLEALDSYLTAKLGPKWWLGTPLEAFAPAE
jgi:hypothetical protein